CTFISPQATTIEYAASDGVNPQTDGPLQVRNAFIVADEDGANGNLVAAIVNTTDKRQTLTVEVEGLEPLTVQVPTEETVSLGADAGPLRTAGLDALPGSTVTVYFQSGDELGDGIEVPVLDGTLPYYEDLVPAEASPEEDASSG